jgi:hypothetical protein
MSDNGENIPPEVTAKEPLAPQKADRDAGERGSTTRRFVRGRSPTHSSHTMDSVLAAFKGGHLSEDAVKDIMAGLLHQEATPTPPPATAARDPVAEVIAQQATITNEPFRRLLMIAEKRKSLAEGESLERQIKTFYDRVNQGNVTIMEAVFACVLFDSDEERTRKSLRALAQIFNTCTNEEERVQQLNHQIMAHYMPHLVNTYGERVVNSRLPLFPAYIKGMEAFESVNNSILAYAESSIRGGRSPVLKRWFKDGVSGGEPYLPVTTDPATGQYAADAASLGPHFQSVYAQMQAQAAEIQRLGAVISDLQQKPNHGQGGRGHAGGRGYHGRGGRSGGGNYWRGGRGQYHHVQGGEAGPVERPQEQPMPQTKYGHSIFKKEG